MQFLPAVAEKILI